MLYTYLVLCLMAAAGGAVNSVAGGGTLLTFPALFAALGSSAGAAVLANGTSTAALVPGSISASWGYRREMRAAWRWARILLIPSFLGSTVGSLLVVVLPARWFESLVPWLILVAALLFTLQPQIARAVGIGQRHEMTFKGKAGAIGFQFLVAVYGGYFGAGIGILMLSTLALMGMSDIHEMNAVKTLLASIINGVSLVVFAASGVIAWRLALPMAAASIVGGYAAAHAARRIDRRIVRATVIVIGFTLAGYYFYRQLAG